MFCFLLQNEMKMQHYNNIQLCRQWNCITRPKDVSTRFKQSHCFNRLLTISLNHSIIIQMNIKVVQLNLTFKQSFR